MSSTGQRVTTIVSRKTSRSARSKTIISTTERLVQLGKGCSCCTVRGDLLTKVRRIAAEAVTDHVMIEASPKSDLVTVAKTFTVADDKGQALSSVARIETLVVAVNGASLRADLKSSDGARVAERIELADVLVVHGGTENDRVMLRALNSHARIHDDDDDAELTLATLRGEAPFDLSLAQQRASLSDVLDRAVPVLQDGVTRFVFAAREPFHPQRLHALLATGWVNVLRARGTFWIACRPEAVGLLNTTASKTTTSLGGRWWAAVPEGRRPTSDAFTRYVESVWHPVFGDRVQEIAIVGIHLDEAELRSRLQSCLLTDDEHSTPELWSSWPNPFAWPEEAS
jgi:G3E family GTPase